MCNDVRKIEHRVFFTSDLHFGHENAIKFDRRPFSSAQEMDEELIRRWNAKVGKGDLVYVLGDMIWKSAGGEASQIIKRLNGQIILIKGNHDRFIKNAGAKKFLAGVKDYDDISVQLEDGTMRRCILSHYYIPFYNGCRHGAIMLYGHSHTSEESLIEIEFSRWLNEHGHRNQSYNVGCMYWNYEPVTLDEILKSEFPHSPLFLDIAEGLREAIELSSHKNCGFEMEDDDCCEE